MVALIGHVSLYRPAFQSRPCPINFHAGGKLGPIISLRDFGESPPYTHGEIKIRLGGKWVEWIRFAKQRFGFIILTYTWEKDIYVRDSRIWVKLPLREEWFAIHVLGKRSLRGKANSQLLKIHVNLKIWVRTSCDISHNAFIKNFSTHFFKCQVVKYFVAAMIVLASTLLRTPSSFRQLCPHWRI